MNDLGKNVRNVMVVFLFCFIALISYMVYFQVFKGPDIAAMPGNVRLWAKRNEVIRGTIYDRNGEALTKSKRIDELSQDREYVYKDLYTHSLGYIDEQYGITGLEEEFDSELSKYSGAGNNLRKFFKDFDLKTFFKERNQEDEKIGNGVVTTLNPKAQKAAYDLLGDQKGAVVALNPKTGEILAMVSKPTYDPNNMKLAIEGATAENSEAGYLINRAVEGLYPPGSVMKTITLSAALENDPSVANRTFQDKGKITFADGRELNNYVHQVHGAISLRKGFSVSSNVVFGTLAMELGNEKLKAVAENFGFNSVVPAVGTTITKSQFPTLEEYEVGSIAQSGIGQGSVLTTPMEMALMVSAVSNNGMLMQPKLVNKVIDSQGNTVKEIPSKELKQVISPETSAVVRDYMKTLVAGKTFYGWDMLQKYGAGGKTGTADYNLPDGSEAIPHGWFVSIAPADDPQVAIAVIVENGENGVKLPAVIAANVIDAILGKE
ncbi:peptidoglycan D,D-transpeptidase FtsI family protein [Clostridium gasigenes]|uniref:Cell division protein FtsI/penicillin-binding protein 2 n=1 Tax=Clostridium gasigenes TaxID=94869 RepID=A0A1H0QLU6_9CLOT|nr:penicillin-binding protein 2 [Clostridium gasigenes]MBB6624574.1 penicillin-binding protein 2 [Clostridium gasigenes]SDP18361.1 Cell division protein FtsI/penicillin-binding protein 2 [Clostridium gasigenes]